MYFPRVKSHIRCPRFLVVHYLLLDLFHHKLLLQVMLLLDNARVRHTFFVLYVVVDNESGLVNIKVSSWFVSIGILVIFACEFFILLKKSFLEFFISLGIVFFQSSSVQHTLVVLDLTFWCDFTRYNRLACYFFDGRTATSVKLIKNLWVQGLLRLNNLLSS